jgi:PAS domain S-box-containing protein
MSGSESMSSAGTAATIEELRDALGRERAARERAEEALLLARITTDNVAELLLTLSPSGRILDANAAAVRRYGHGRARLLELSIDSLEHAGAPGRFADRWRRMARDGSAVVESLHVDRAGEAFPVEARFARFELGGQAYCCAAVRDLTDQQRDARALRESEGRLRSLIDKLPAAVNLKDREGRYVVANAQFDRWFGLEAGAAIGRNCVNLLGDEAAQGFIRADQQVLSGVASVQWQASLRLDDGLERVLSVSKFPVENAAGEVVAVGSIALDITRLKEVERALRESQERFDLAVRGSSDGLWDWPDLTSDVLWWSPRVYEFLDFSSDAFIPTSGRLYELTHPDDRARVEQARRRHLEERLPLDIEHRLRTRSGDYRWFRVRGQATRDRAGQPVRLSGSVQDVTTHRLAEERRISAVRAQRDALVREVHHRIKNHLQGIMGLLTQYAARDPTFEEVARRIRNQVNSIAVVHGIQGRSNDGVLRLAGVVDAILQAARGVYSHSFVDLDRGAMAGVGLAEQEAVPVALVLNELVTNAIKHCDPQRIEGRAVRVIPFQIGDRVGLRVVNIGGGLPQGFDFESGAGLGTGLGLVRALLPPEGVEIRFETTADGVVVELLLDEPVVYRTIARIRAEDGVHA